MAAFPVHSPYSVSSALFARNSYHAMRPEQSATVPTETASRVSSLSLPSSPTKNSKLSPPAKSITTNSVAATQRNTVRIRTNRSIFDLLLRRAIRLYFRAQGGAGHPSQGVSLRLLAVACEERTPEKKPSTHFGKI